MRIVTAAALFDGHDAAINIMRRIIQATGCEVIHLGHNRAVQEIVDCAIQEDAQGIAITSYQGGHVEYFKYMYDLLHERGAGHIKLFGGGGGVILPEEIKELHDYGIDRIFSPEDGLKMGLQGMIDHLVAECDYPTVESLKELNLAQALQREGAAMAKAISYIENFPDELDAFHKQLNQARPKDHQVPPVVGISGTGGAGKSSLVDELIRRYLRDHPDKTIAIISVDPSKRKTGGALLGDRIRMNAINDARVYMRSMATRQANLSLSPYIGEAIELCKQAGYDMVIAESSGVGQADASIVDYCDVAMYAMTPEFGAATQLEKIDMLDYAHLVSINKFDKKGAQDALRDVKKQYQRNHMLFEQKVDAMPVYGTIASQFNDPGTNVLYRRMMDKVVELTGAERLRSSFPDEEAQSEKIYIIPPERVRYLSEITEESHRYKKFVREQKEIASQLYQLHGTIQMLEKQNPEDDKLDSLKELYRKTEEHLHPECKRLLEAWPEMQKAYTRDQYTYTVRGRDIKVDLYVETLSHLQVPKVSLPKYQDWGDILNWLMRENVPGEFPFTAGVFPFKRAGEDPTRMFAGEGGPERTNKRFHYVSQDNDAKRLSTAFDSVTLYGEDPHERPDIYGKIGNAGVNVATLDDAKKLYSGFNLADPKTSVSMTINGPAPIVLGFFMNAAIDQQCELYVRAHGMEEEVEQNIQKLYRETGAERACYQGELPPSNDGLGLMLLGTTGDQVLDPETYARIKADTLNQVRGTVQADILKEDQAQNTCIFSSEFSLRLMGDIQQYFIEQQVRNFYSVSISGYHIAEAGANPITQLALTLSNAFTYVEYYLHRGMDINDFAPNLSFFFSNGVDAEYAVIGRVARRLWAKAIKNLYGGNKRAQMLKYHIQTSGRSLHAQEISFNDIRTTLQALYAIYDNCNSLHTNAYDEAITTPTEESVRRAIAIQLIINRELGMAKNENPNQGSFVIEELTELVEEAVYAEFDRITERGGVLGAMETMYQRNKIQEESMYYEHLKHNGELPVVGVNTYVAKGGVKTETPGEVIRSTEEEKRYQIAELRNFQHHNQRFGSESLDALQHAALHNGNCFEKLMTATKYSSLGQISRALYEVGGQYRRSM